MAIASSPIRIPSRDIPYPPNHGRPPPGTGGTFRTPLRADYTPRIKAPAGRFPPAGAVTQERGLQPRLIERPDWSRLRSMFALAKWACFRDISAIGAAYVSVS